MKALKLKKGKNIKDCVTGCVVVFNSVDCDVISFACIKDYCLSFLHASLFFYHVSGVEI